MFSEALKKIFANQQNNYISLVTDNIRKRPKYRFLWSHRDLKKLPQSEQSKIKETHPWIWLI